jgi:hypothetical protein
MAIFTVPMDAVAVSAVQDLWHIKAGATNGLFINSIELNQKTLTTVEGKELRLKRHTVTVTQGSGGTTPTPQKMAPGGAASGTTVHMNDTTRASAGTLTVIAALTWQFLNGFLWMPAREDRPYIDISTGFVVELSTAPSGSMTVSGTITFEEVGI